MSDSNIRTIPALEQWAMETAAALAPSLEGLDRVRIAVGLIQARSKEVHRWSGNLYLQPHPVARGIGVQMGDCHEALEKLALEMAVRAMKEAEEPKVIQ